MGGTVTGAHGLDVVVTDDPGDARLRAWDDMVRARPLSDVAQLSAWARVRAAAGYGARYVLVERDGALLGGAQVLVRRVPLIGEVGYVPYGPLLAPTAEEDAEVAEAVADGLRQLASGRTRMLFVQPPEGGEPAAAALRAGGFRPSAASVSPSVSLRVRLDVDADVLRRSLPKRMRKRIAHWARSGVTVRVGDADDLPTFAQLTGATGEHQGFTSYGLDYLTAMFQHLSPGGHIVLHVGEYEGRPVAMQLCTGSGGILTTRLTGFDRASPGAHLRVPAATIWAAMVWGRENGYRWFDFGGIEEESAAVLEAGGPVQDMVSFDQAKTYFGGRLLRYPQAVELIASPWLRVPYDLARRSSAGSAVLAAAQRAARAGRALPRRTHRR